MSARILDLFRRDQTIFTFKEIALLWKETDEARLRRTIHYAVKTGKLYPVRKGIYAKDPNYDVLELATKIFTPSYISLETVLQKEGVTFQYYESIFVASYVSRTIQCDGKTFIFKKIKNDVLTNPAGIKNKETHAVASKERALLDALYLYKNYHFDNVSSIDWKKCSEIATIYQNKRLLKDILSLQTHAQSKET